MNIDFIKWLVDYADGFEYFWSDETLEYKDHFGCYLDDITHRHFQYKKVFDDIYYPLLLQRAIEGINSTIRKYDIRYIDNNIKVYDCENDNLLANYWRFADIDQAKEQALKYIYGVENENN